MDELDLRILATMGYVPWSPTAGDVDRLRPSSVADQLDVTQETVRERVRGMEEAGVVRAWEAYPNPAHADLEVGGWAFRPPSRETVDEALEEALLVDGVIELFTYRGPFVGAALAYRDRGARDRRLELLGRRLGDPEPVHLLDPPMPSVDRELDGLDWAIVAALRGRARRSLGEVADEVDRSYRTVKRRVDRMSEEGSLFVAPRVDLSRVAGILPFTLALVVREPPRDVAARARETLGDRLLHRLVPPDDDAELLVLGAFAPTVAAMEALRDRVAGLEGVRRARALLSAGRHPTDWLDEQLRRRVADA